MVKTPKDHLKRNILKSSDNLKIRQERSNRGT